MAELEGGRIAGCGRGDSPAQPHPRHDTPCHQTTSAQRCIPSPRSLHYTGVAGCAQRSERRGACPARSAAGRDASEEGPCGQGSGQGAEGGVPGWMSCWSGCVIGMCRVGCNALHGAGVAGAGAVACRRPRRAWCQHAAPPPAQVVEDKTFGLKNKNKSKVGAEDGPRLQKPWHPEHARVCLPAGTPPSSPLPLGPGAGRTKVCAAGAGVAASQPEAAAAGGAVSQGCWGRRGDAVIAAGGMSCRFADRGRWRLPRRPAGGNMAPGPPDPLHCRT